jgi:hypothetical protein
MLAGMALGEHKHVNGFELGRAHALGDDPPFHIA